MKRAVLLLLSIAVTAVPLSAQQGVDIGLWAVHTSLGGDNVIDAADDVEIEFDENIGYGVTADVYWSDLISTEIGIYGFDADGTLNIGFLDETIDLGSLDVMPVTLTLRAHVGSDRFDLYVGAGGAYAMFENLQSDDLRFGGTEFIEIDDEFTWLANAGMKVGLGQNFALGLDVKWVPLEGTAIDNEGLEEITLELDPLMVSAGFMMRF